VRRSIAALLRTSAASVLEQFISNEVCISILNSIKKVDERWSLACLKTPVEVASIVSAQPADRTSGFLSDVFPGNPHFSQPTIMRIAPELKRKNQVQDWKFGWSYFFFAR